MDRKAHFSLSVWRGWGHICHEFSSAGRIDPWSLVKMVSIYTTETPQLYGTVVLVIYTSVDNNVNINLVIVTWAKSLKLIQNIFGFEHLFIRVSFISLLTMLNLIVYFNIKSTGYAGLILLFRANEWLLNSSGWVLYGCISPYTLNDQTMSIIWPLEREIHLFECLFVKIFYDLTYFN